ncbi:hypothetical protein OIM90_28940 [Streptomyces sp. AD16]|nr:hypothetical protein OIM90_28940 [Streptomyces sp. AD16]
MHRTRTAAALLATVAVTALAGCVTVDRPAGPGSPTGRSPPPPPQPGNTPSRRSNGPRPVRVCAASGRSPPARLHGHRAPGPRRRLPAPAGGARPSRSRAAGAGPRRPARSPGQAAGGSPADPGVCALGHQYGKWPQGSPQSRICEDAYGR